MIIKKIIQYFQWMIDEHIQKKSVEKIYDELAMQNSYDDLVNYSSREKGFEKALELVALKPKKALDLACGTGAMIEAINKKYQCNIIGIDISNQMLELARNRFKKNKKITLVRGDFLRGSYPQNSFDLITIAFSTRFIPQDKEKLFIKKIKAWLKPKGIFIAVIMETPYKKFAYKVFRIINFRGHNNLDMNDKNYFVKSMSKVLTFVKESHISTQYNLYFNYALIFKKSE